MTRLLVLLLLASPVAASAQGFVDRTFAAGLGGVSNTNGVAVADYDRDGDLDLYVVARPAFDAGDLRTYSRLYRNDGRGVFDDVTLGAGITVRTAPTEEETRGFGIQYVAAWGDYDDDGFPDLFLGHMGPDQLFRNRGDGTFEEVTAQAGVAGEGGGKVTSSATWFDHDHDGDLDLYVGSWWDYGPDRDLRNRLYENRGDGTFADVSAASGADDDGATWAALPFDADGDGWTDLYLTTDTDTTTGAGVNRLYLNERDGTFRDATDALGVGDTGYGMGVTLGDADGNGLLDLYLTNVATPSRFQRNPLFLQTAPGEYENRGDEAGVGIAGWGWGTEFIDAEADGHQDLVVVTGLFDPDYQNYFFRNTGAAAVSFEEVAATVGFDDPIAARGLAVFDADGDGDQDLLVSRIFNEPPILYENRLPQGAWLLVELEGTDSNHFGVGAVVEAWVDGVPEVRLNHGAQYLGHNLTPVHLGLGDATAVDSLVVRWPSGRVDRVGGVAVDRRVKVVEGEGLGTPTASPDGPRPTALRVVVGPNPSLGRVSVRVEGAAGPVRIAVADVLGRRVAAAEGPEWTGRLAAGTYLVRAEEGGAVAVGRVTVVR